jgi:hypothetical protein
MILNLLGWHWCNWNPRRNSRVYNVITLYIIIIVVLSKNKKEFDKSKWRNIITLWHKGVSAMTWFQTRILGSLPLEREKSTLTHTHVYSQWWLISCNHRNLHSEHCYKLFILISSFSLIPSAFITDPIINIHFLHVQQNQF